MKKINARGWSIAATAALATAGLASPALAAPAPQFGDPVKIGDGLTLDPMIDGRLRYENVGTPTVDANAATLRLRTGLELKHRSGLSFLAEGEGTLAISESYNAFPFAIADSQRRTQYAVVADPMNMELNRLQLQYKTKTFTGTIGRQRINLDDQRFVGSVGWRQNEQTFDAARVEANLGKVAFDGTYAISQRTIFGIDAGPRLAYDGKFWFLGASTKLAGIQAKAFSYLLDYDPAEQAGTLAAPNADTQTFGARLAGAWPLSKKAKLALAGSYARQSDYAGTVARYSVDYIAAEATVSTAVLGATAGYEKLGGNGAQAFQTPMATLHKFNGWADLFLTTPANGLTDLYAGATWKFPKVKSLPGLNTAVTWHRFTSDVAALHYGTEWDASVGFKLGRTNLLAKYADYKADKFGVNTSKFWLQLEFAY